MDVRVRLNAATEGYATWKDTALTLAARAAPPLSPGMLRLLTPVEGGALAGEQGMVVPQGDVAALRADSLHIQAMSAGGAPVMDPLLEEPVQHEGEPQDCVEFVIRVPRSARRVTVDIEE